MGERITNALDELEDFLSENGSSLEQIDMGILGLTHFDDEGNQSGIDVFIVSSPNEVKRHLRGYIYNSGYGEQYLFGILLLSDGRWLERKEYDGAERWEIKSPPTPQDLINYKSSKNPSVQAFAQQIKYAQKRK